MVAVGLWHITCINKDFLSVPSLLSKSVLFFSRESVLNFSNAFFCVY